MFAILTYSFAISDFGSLSTTHFPSYIPFVARAVFFVVPITLYFFFNPAGPVFESFQRNIKTLSREIDKP